MATFILKESLTGQKMIGAALIVAGLLVIARK